MCVEQLFTGNNLLFQWKYAFKNQYEIKWDQLLLPINVSFPSPQSFPYLPSTMAWWCHLVGSWTITALPFLLPQPSPLRLLVPMKALRPRRSTAVCHWPTQVGHVIGKTFLGGYFTRNEQKLRNILLNCTIMSKGYCDNVESYWCFQLYLEMKQLYNYICSSSRKGLELQRCSDCNRPGSRISYRPEKWGQRVHHQKSSHQQSLKCAASLGDQTLAGTPPPSPKLFCLSLHVCLPINERTSPL